VTLKRGVSAGLIGLMTFMFALIYVPQCRVQIYAENTTWISLGLAGVMTFLAYRFR